jgi:excisionase family DNA binding protein
MNPRTDGRLLIPATQAARKLGISRRTLTKHIGAGLIRSVKVGSRASIPQSEIDRIVNGEPKPETPNGISLSAKDAENLCQSRHNSDEDQATSPKSPKEWLDELLSGEADFREAQNAVRDS